MSGHSSCPVMLARNTGVKHRPRTHEGVDRNAARLVREFAGMIKSSRLCNNASCKGSGSLHPKEYQLKILERILSKVMSDPYLTGYVQCVPGSGVSAIEVLVPHLLMFADQRSDLFVLRNDLFVIITPRLMSINKIAEDATLIPPLGSGVRIHTCSGNSNCDLKKMISGSGKAKLLIMTYQMLINLYKNKKEELSSLAKHSGVIILDYPDVNGVRKTTEKALKELVSKRGGSVIAFLAWGNEKVEELLGREIAKIRMDDVCSMFTLTNFIKDDQVGNRPRSVAKAVDRYLRALMNGGTWLYRTALIVTNMRERAEGIASSLRSRGYDNVVVLRSDKEVSRVLAEEGKYLKRIIIDTGSLAAGYDHMDVDILFLDTRVGPSKYAVYRGIVSRKWGSVSPLKAGHGISLIVDLVRDNIENEQKFCSRHGLVPQIKEKNYVNRLLTLISNPGTTSRTACKSMRDLGTTPPRASRSPRPNGALGKALIREGKAQRVCDSLEIIKKGMYVLVYYINGGRRRRVGKIRYSNFEDAAREIMKYVDQYCVRFF